MSIDVDKERKAYCAWAETIADRQFQTMTLEEVWLAAKRHAAEVGEPVRNVFFDNLPNEMRRAPAAPSGASVDSVARDAGCSICGCVGLHACMGAKMEPWTPEKIAELDAVLAQYELAAMSPTKAGEG